MEAAGIEPSAEIVASADGPSGCHLGGSSCGANTVHGDGGNCPTQASNDPTLHWVAQHWNQLPLLVVALLQQLDNDQFPLEVPYLSEPQSCETNAIDLFAWRLAQRCRSIVQGCLREEEWLDADREFCTAIRDEIQRSLRTKTTKDLPIVGSIGT